MTQSKYTPKNVWLKIIIPLFLGVCCLYYILTNFEWKEIWQILQTADIVTFIFSSIVTTLIFWLLRTFRWSILLQSENINISFGKLYLYTAVTVGFANFTPFQSGEALKVEMSRKDGGNRVAGYKFFLFEKLLDLVVIAFLALLGVFVLFGASINNYLPQAIVGLIIISIILMIAVFFIFQRWRVETNLFPTSLVFIQSLVLTLASWVIMTLGWKLMFQSIAINISFLQTSAVIALTTIIGILSFVPGAIGVTEISVAALLTQLGFKHSITQAGAVLIGIYSLAILLLSVFHLIILKTVNSHK